MENKNGQGIFYGVIGVATLVVAIIGATFAYFSASATSNADITGTTAAAGGITLTVTPVTNTGSNLIPLNLVTGDTAGVDTVDQFADAIGSTKGASCVDSNGNNVCQVYSITVTNSSTTSSVQVRGTLNLTGTNTKNMKWQLLTDATSTTRADYATVVAQDTVGNITVGGNTGTTGSAAASKTLGFTSPDNSATYYVLVWLEETGNPQEDKDASGSFTGTVTFNAVDASGNTSGVTASFSA